MDMPNKLFSLLNLIRFDRPVGFLLLFFPCSFGVALAAVRGADYFFLVTFFLGSIIMRSAGCIINDILDVKIDAKVERTKNRPLVTGEVTVNEALMLLAILLFCGLILLSNLSLQAILIGLVVMILVVFYPLAKRITDWPQIVLGFIFGSGVLIAYSSIAHYLHFSAILTYIGVIFWIIGYDTIYAFMDIKDDEAAGVKSSALFLRNYDYKKWIGAFYLAFWFLSLLGAILEGRYSVMSLVFGSLGVLSILAWQVHTLDINSPKNCMVRFKSNVLVGFIWMIALL
jgi:4-hydroxybenzoate polyprenyltransferase